MRRSWWITGALASLAIGGCAHQRTKDEEALGRLPMEQKEVVFTADHNVQVAEANRAAADRAVDQAKTFKEVTEKEVGASKERLEAVDKALSYARQSGQPQNVDTQQKIAKVSQTELVTFESKKDYAERLKKLREQQRDLADRRLDLAKKELEIAQVQTLQRAGTPPAQNPNDLINDRAKIQADITAREREVALTQEQVDATRATWNQNRSAYLVAARNVPTAPLDNPPPAPPVIPAEPLPQAPPPSACPPGTAK